MIIKGSVARSLEQLYEARRKRLAENLTESVLARMVELGWTPELDDALFVGGFRKGDYSIYLPLESDWTLYKDREAEIDYVGIRFALGPVAAAEYQAKRSVS